MRFLLGDGRPIHQVDRASPCESGSSLGGDPGPGSHSVSRRGWLRQELLCLAIPKIVHFLTEVSGLQEVVEGIRSVAGAAWERPGAGRELGGSTHQSLSLVLPESSRFRQNTPGTSTLISRNRGDTDEAAKNRMPTAFVAAVGGPVGSGQPGDRRRPDRTDACLDLVFDGARWAAAVVDFEGDDCRRRRQDGCY